MGNKAGQENEPLGRGCGTTEIPAAEKNAAAYCQQQRKLPDVLEVAALCWHPPRSAPAQPWDSQHTPRRVLAGSVETARIDKANPAERGVAGSARMTVSDRDLNLK